MGWRRSSCRCITAPRSCSSRPPWGAWTASRSPAGSTTPRPRRGARAPVRGPGPQPRQEHHAQARRPLARGGPRRGRAPPAARAGRLTDVLASGPMPDDPLTLPVDELRRLGHRVVDLVVAHLEGLRDEPPIRTGTREELEALLREPPPEAPGDVDAALDLLAGEVLARMQHGDHPRFFARVPSPSNGVSALGDALSAGFNAFAGSWAGGAAAAPAHVLLLGWPSPVCRPPPGAPGEPLHRSPASAPRPPPPRPH